MRSMSGISTVLMQLNCDAEDKPEHWPESILVTKSGEYIAGHFETGLITIFPCWEFLAYVIDSEGGEEISIEDYYCVEPAVDGVSLDKLNTELN